MTWVDWIAALASGYGSACLQLRAQALKPRMGDYPVGPGDVRRALFILSLILGAYSLTVLVGDYGASRTEALQWTIERGSRSGRVAYQFARDWAARHV